MAAPAHELAPLARALRRGELRLSDYLDALESVVESREPEVLALLPEPGRFERLRREAERLVVRCPDPAARPPLFGVPVGVKDIFHVAGFATCAGSRLPAAELAGPEAECVGTLRAEGALVLGKTVSTEFAYFAPGPTRNPRDPGRTPGGSSSGSAAAVAAGYCPLALGTQTIGSISRPASYCGIVGFKPSYERISRAGVIPLAPSVDHVGLFTRDAEGAMVAARCLVRDWHEEAEPAAQPVLGVPEGPYLERASASGREGFEAARERLQEAGYRVERVEVMTDFDRIVEHHERIVAAEAARVHSGWYPRFGDLYHPKTAALVERGRDVTDVDLARAVAGRERLRGELEAAMKESGVDLWISPAAPGEAPAGLESTGDPVMSLPWTHAGLPTLALPAGRGPAGLPLGIQLAAGWRRDEILCAWAIGIERALAEGPAREAGR